MISVFGHLLDLFFRQERASVASLAFPVLLLRTSGSPPIQSCVQPSAHGACGKMRHDPAGFHCSRHSLVWNISRKSAGPHFSLSVGNAGTACLAPIGTGRAVSRSPRHVLRLGKQRQGPIAHGPSLPRPVVLIFSDSSFKLCLLVDASLIFSFL